MTRQPEHDEQVALFNWAAYFESKCPSLGMMFAIPNGGHRHKAVAGKMKAEGVKAGVPDIFLAVRGYSIKKINNIDARILHAGLFIEKKNKPKKTTKSQEIWIQKLRESGYQCNVCYSWIEAAKEICAYLELDPGEYGLEGR